MLQAYFHAAALAGGSLERRPGLGRRPSQRRPAGGDPAHPPGRGTVLGRTAARRAARRRPHGRQHDHDGAAVDGAVLPGVDPAPLHPGPRSSRHRPESGLVERGGTVYLLGRDDPYASASPLMTAIAEHVLDTALSMAMASPYGRLCPSFLACLDELPSTTPLPTLRTRMANERALGLSFIYAAQTWRQLVICYGEDEARAMFGLTNNIVVFGGGKDVEFYQEVSDLLGTTRVSRRSYNHHHGGWGSSLLRRGRAGPPTRGDPAAAGAARAGRRRERPPVRRAAVAVHRRASRARRCSRHRQPHGRAALEPRRRRHEPPVGHHGRAVPEPLAGRGRRCSTSCGSPRRPPTRPSTRAGGSAMLPRPWDPPSCPGELRRLIYVWLDEVVGWINEEHTWRTDRVIPICWDLAPAHRSRARAPSRACAGRRPSP